MTPRDSRGRRSGKGRRRDNQAGPPQRWTPFAPTGQVVPPLGPGTPEGVVWANSRYIVVVRSLEPTSGAEGGGTGTLVWLSIKSRQNDARHDWRDFQRIKNELVGPEAEAVELYPAESRRVDGANQYHLWCFPHFRFPFGFAERMVSDQRGEAGRGPGHP